MIAYSPYNIPMSLWSTVVNHLISPDGFSSETYSSAASPSPVPPLPSGV